MQEGGRGSSSVSLKTENTRRSQEHLWKRARDFVNGLGGIAFGHFFLTFWVSAKL